ncbi:sulfatase-like hydrolase/transferase [Paraglaciecola aquimarina]|uniref:Sulfatase-like hydrolase/transferase n=1 Tax=Paraglaciecola algarum TaxID=3050085 RepID=A0ABS9D427_9ALTE|nr:sulfatase-like hydrolase/transferase [Paraglaciecola sp. G1-23]
MKNFNNKHHSNLVISSFIVFFSVLLPACSIQNKNTASHEKVEPEAPNILFIYTDDQAPWAIGSSGNKQAITPNLDKFASQGMSFPNAYTTTPVCSPSRAGLMTSRYGYELGIDDWINTHYKSLTHLEPELGLDTSLQTWPDILQDAGYYTGLIGKWHLGELDKYHPTKQGYHEFTGFRSGGNSPIHPKIEKDGVVSTFKGLTSDVLTQEAIGFIQRNHQKKFALSLHYRAPHTKWLPVAPEDEAPYKNMDMVLPHPNYPDLNVKKAKKSMAEYLSSVRSIDRNVGTLLAELDKLGLAENTLVVFTSDHGYNMGHNGIWHKGNGHWILNKNPKGTKNIPAGDRPNMYDNSLKVPTIVRWPSVVKANTRNMSSVSNLDWFPTIVEIAKGKTAAQSTIRGKSFISALQDEQLLVSTDYYAAYSTLHQSITQMRMYSDGQFKLVKDFKNKGRDEFYDLQKDPGETQNLIATTNPKLQQKINAFDDIIFKKMLATDDPVLEQFFGDKK